MITDLRVEFLNYEWHGEKFRATNLMYKIDGEPASSRCPGIWTLPNAETLLRARMKATNDRKNRV